MERLRCRICGNVEQNKEIILKGTMYGTHGKFAYFLCSRCGCLQICEKPEDIAEYYDPEKYYSFNMDKRTLKNRLLFAQLQNQVTGFKFLGALVEFLYPVNYRYLRRIAKTDAVLDVGCGDGELLRWMRQLGYENVMGIDPFVEQDILQDGKILVKKGDIVEQEMEQSFRMITMIHSLEHVFEQREVFAALAGCLEADGFLVVQLPVLSRYYWEKYGADLYTLDPPRHFYLHTEKSLRILAEEFGFELLEYATEIDVAIPEMAKHVADGNTEKNNGTGLVKGTISALTSLGLRRRLREQKDGAIATAVFQKRRDITPA